ncbi:hypothetical protein [Nucisporomicrobium flavum]|uniref:hypothetical protein n=1 Tax=Nucisporomicrobium flavum TaxID=2785915 RepID=UPI0018F772E5|nr:hypothetical protein [Nucisporomicrobium flavum]
MNDYVSLQDHRRGLDNKPRPHAAAATASTMGRHRTFNVSTPGRIRPRRFPIIASVLAALMLVGAAVVAGAGPAQAASYRDIKSVRYGNCFYAYGDPLEDLYLQKCSTTPAKYGNWSVTLAGYYNNHPLWILKRQGGSCLGVLGNAASNYLYVSCSPTNSRNVWEVFTTSSGRYVLKSFGAYQSWGQHKCLTFPTSGGIESVRLGACSLTSTANMIYR